MLSQAQLRDWGNAGLAPHLGIANSAPDTRYPSLPYSGPCNFHTWDGKMRKDVSRGKEGTRNIPAPSDWQYQH